MAARGRAPQCRIDVMTSLDLQVRLAKIEDGDCLLELRADVVCEGRGLGSCGTAGTGDGSFPLQEALEKASPYAVTSWSRLYQAAGIPTIDIGKLAYFGASVFWRASVHNFRTGKHRGTTRGLLGPYEAEFREYLLGNREFP